MRAAGGLTPPLRARTWRTLIGLVAVTGMRQGEACRLGRGDVDLDAVPEHLALAAGRIERADEEAAQ